MKLSASEISSALGFALVVLTPLCAATHGHHSLHQQYAKRHVHQHGHGHIHPALRADDIATIEKRGTCEFPAGADPNLVAITPDKMNAGWAMSPDQACKKDSYCPYACKPGMVMAQWDPDSTYDYPASMNGGLYCDSNGQVSKPFKNKPYCVKGTGAVKAVNKLSKGLSWCQTVLPGNEAMIIPTEVTDVATIAVPDSSYWCETAAHFYLNPPGSSSSDCVWGDDSKPVGNWSPYVAGANTDANGNTFVKLGYNPIFEESALDRSQIDFAVKIECPDGGCTGLPCGIDPTKGKGLVDSLLSATGAGGSDFCVVTVSKGSTCNVVTYAPGGDSDSGDVKDDEEEDLGTESVETTTSSEPTTTEEPTTTSSAEPTTSSEPTTTSEPPTTTSSTSTSTSKTTSSTSTSPSTTKEKTTSTSTSSTSTSTSASSSTSSSTTKKSKPSISAGIFHENGSNSTTTETTSASTTIAVPEATSGSAEDTQSKDEKDFAGRQSSPTIAGLLIAFIATACFF